MNSKKAELSLLLVALFWGISFILSKNVLNELSTFNFLAIRFFIAFIISGLIFFPKIKLALKNTDILILLKYSFFTGSILFLSFAFQTLGLNYTTASNSAFISGLNVVIVPILCIIFIKDKLEAKIIISSIIAIFGLFLLTYDGNGVSLRYGDFLTLICAFMFALYIVSVDKLGSKIDTITFAILQLGVVSILSFLTSFIFESPTFPKTFLSWSSIAALSILCTSLAYVLQNIAQKYVSASKTALIYSTEPVFAALFSMMLGVESIKFNTILGGFLIFIGMLISEVDIKKLIKEFV